MDAKKCDLCGGYYDEPEEDPKYVLAKRISGKRVGDEFDLCPNCQKLLDAWIEGRAVIDMISPEEFEIFEEKTDDGASTGKWKETRK